MNKQTEKTINGLMAGKSFFNQISILGKNLLFILGLASIFSFWVIIVIFYEPLINVAVLMLKLFQFSLILFAIGIIFSLLLRFLVSLIYKREMEKLEKIAVTNGKKPGKRGKRT